MLTRHFADDSVTLYHGDCLDVLRELPDCSVDSVVTDPPYGLEFMGKEWDAPWAQHFTGINGGAPLPDRQLHVNPTCRSCGGTQRGTKKPCKCESPEWSDTQAAAVGRKNRGFQDWCELWVIECLRVLKPGGHLLAFGGSRTWHRLAVAVEDAGFEIRDSIFWLYGSGFPKSLDVSKAIDKAAGAEREDARHPGFTPFGPGSPRCAVCEKTKGSQAGNCRCVDSKASPKTDAAKQWQGWGTALKPSAEPIVVGRKPLQGTVAANVLQHGTGALNIDACRTAAGAEYRDLKVPQGGNHRHDVGLTEKTRHAPFTPAAGRWPTNVVMDESQAAELDRQTGVSQSRIGKPRGASAGDGWGMTATGAEYADQGGASRFFPTFILTDADRAWRERMETLPTFRYEAKAPTSERPTSEDGSAHPTVKPLDLMRWLVRLVTPPGGKVLDPFAGSGTTGEACLLEGFDCILMEREAAYLPLIVQRVSKPIQTGFDFGGVPA